MFKIMKMVCMITRHTFKKSFTRSTFVIKKDVATEKSTCKKYIHVEKKSLALERFLKKLFRRLQLRFQRKKISFQMLGK